MTRQQKPISKVPKTRDDHCCVTAQLTKKQGTDFTVPKSAEH